MAIQSSFSSSYGFVAPSAIAIINPACVFNPLNSTLEGYFVVYNSSQHYQSGFPKIGTVAFIMPSSSLVLSDALNSIESWAINNVASFSLGVQVSSPKAPSFTMPAI